MKKKYDWENYLIIEDEFIEAKKYLSFERDANLDADSPFLQNEIVLLGSKVEMAMKKLISYRNPDRLFNPSNISDYRKILLVLFPDIELYGSNLLHTDSQIVPFEDWSKTKLKWWEAYNGIKHGSSRLPKLDHALKLLSAYQILLFLIHFEEEQDKDYVFYTFDEMPRLLDLQFHHNLYPFGQIIGFGFPKNQINVCADDSIILNVIEKIKENNPK